MRFVDAAFVETVPDKLETWRQVRFDVHVQGRRLAGHGEGERLERDFAAVGVDVVYFPYTVHTSSTQLRRALPSTPWSGAAQRRTRAAPGTTW